MKLSSQQIGDGAVDTAQIHNSSIKLEDLASETADRLIPDPANVTDGYVLTRDAASTGKRKWAAAGGGSADIWRLSPADKPPDSANAKDDEFIGASLDAKWSWINQGSSTATIEGKRLKLVPQYKAALNSRAIAQSAPSGNFSVATKFTLTCPKINYAILGLVFVSADGKQVYWGPQATSGGVQLKIIRLADATSYTSQNGYNVPETPWGDGSMKDLYLKAEVSRTNSNIKLYVGVNGYDWLLVATEDFSTHLGDVDKIGLAALHENTNATVVCRFEWFRVDWTPDY